MVPMRRKDREVTDFDRIIEVISRCEVLRLGLADGDFPYIVPVNFSFEADKKTKHIDFYIHGAMAGRKYQLLRKNKACSFELDVPLKMDFLYDAHDITMRYESVMGTASVEEIEPEDKERIMQEKILSRWEEAAAFPWNKAALERCGMFRISVKEISCKINPVKGSAD